MTGSSYTEHVDFGDRISAGVVGKEQRFKVKIDGDTIVIGDDVKFTIDVEIEKQ